MAFNEKRKEFMDALDELVSGVRAISTFSHHVGPTMLDACTTIEKYRDDVIRKPVAHGGRALVKSSKRDRFISALKQGPVPVSWVFDALGWGPKEAHAAVRERRKIATDDSDMMWIAMRDVNGVKCYDITGYGPTQPKGPWVR